MTAALALAGLAQLGVFAALARALLALPEATRTPIAADPTAGL